MEPATFSRPSPIAEPSSPEAGPPVPHILPSNQPNPSSKNQIRKRAKQAKYDALRVLRPAKRREEKKIRREKRQCLSDQGIIAPVRSSNRRRPTLQVANNNTVVLDFGFDELMTAQEITSISTQLSRCYSTNRQSPSRIHLVATGMGGKLKERLDSFVPGYKNWNDEFMRIHEQSYLELFDPSRLVYLTADSPNILSSFDDTKVYIIGGVVDRNRHKGLCFNKAQLQNIQTAQLPITEFLVGTSRKILTVNQVFDIIMGVIESGTDAWKTTFEKIIPARKLKNHQNGRTSDDDGAIEEDGDVDSIANEQTEALKANDKSVEASGANHVGTSENENAATHPQIVI